MAKSFAGGIVFILPCPAQEELEQLAPETLTQLALLLACVVFTAGITGCLILNTYKLDRKRHAEVLSGINRMSTEKA